VKLIKETIPLPKTRGEVIASFSAALHKGGVQRIIVQLNEPISVERLVRVDDPAAMGADVPAELLEPEDPMMLVRNAPMEELSFSKDLPPFEYLFKAFYFLSQKNLKAKAILVRDMTTLREWLGVDQSFFNLYELFGVEVKQVRDLPKDSAILAAASSEETDVNAITLSIRLSLNVKPEEPEHAGDEANREEGPGVGTGGQTLRPADGAVGVPARGLNGAGQNGRPQGSNKGAAPKAGGGHRK
jgi:hypothetical protein